MIMDNNENYLKAIEKIKSLLNTFKPGQEIYDQIVSFKDQVVGKYGTLFSIDNIPRLTKEEFSSFLYFENNHHWSSLYRMGVGATSDMELLRRALIILVEEVTPIGERFSKSLELVRGFGKALASAILLVCYPTKYGVWNSTSEEAIKRLGLWPSFNSKNTIGEKYEVINEILLKISNDLSMDFWTLDSFWWYFLETTKDTDETQPKKISDLLQKVLDLQENWSSANTPDMQKRGENIRYNIPSRLKDVISQLGADFSDYQVEGRDGIGKKTVSVRPTHLLLLRRTG
jgi:hypothetical protein